MISPYKPIEDIRFEQERQRKAEIVCAAIKDILTHKEEMIKIASGKKQTIGDFIEKYGLSSDIDISEVEASTDKEAKKVTGEYGDEVTIKIISKEIKDPHYEIVVELADMEKNDIDITAVSFYCKDGYLGRYLLKRDMYFLRKNKTKAREAMAEIIEASKEVKERYYSGKIISGEIFKELNNIAQTREGDFTFKTEETIGTTVTRRHLNESSVYGWFYRSKERADEIREASMGPMER